VILASELAANDSAWNCSSGGNLTNALEVTFRP